MEVIIVMLVVIPTVVIIKLMDEINKITDGYKETLENYELALEREEYLLKMINDSLSVTDMAGFIAQRMRNAPEKFEKADLDKMNLDKINC